MPIAAAIFAAFLFTVFELILDEVQRYMSADIYMLTRISFTLLILYLLDLVIRGFGYQTSPRHSQAIKKTSSYRALAGLSYLSLIALAFELSSSQSIVYAVFMMHPLLQPFAFRLVTGKWPWSTAKELADDALPIALILIAAVLFICYIFQTNTCGDAPLKQLLCVANLATDENTASINGSTILACGSALLASFLFTAFNELGNKLTGPTMSRGHGLTSFDALFVTTRSMANHLWIFAALVPACLFVADEKFLTSPVSGQRISGFLDVNVWGLILFGYAIVVLGGFVFTWAVKSARNSAHVGAMDVFIFPFGFAFDLVLGKAHSTVLGYAALGLGMLLLFYGTYLLATKAKKSTEGTGKLN